MTDRELSREDADRVVEVEAEVRDNDRRQVSDIADVLAEHMFVPIKLRIEGRICTCGDPNGPLETFGTDAAAHRAHVASALEPLIRAREKAAWDRGVEAHSDDYTHTLGNPYETGADQ